MYFERGKNGRKICFMVPLLCRRVSTSTFFLNPKIFYQNHFCMSNNYKIFFLFIWKSSSGLVDVVLLKKE